MNQDAERELAIAINTIAQSDPLIKLLQQVKLGRMKQTDVGLRAVTETWLGTYKTLLQNTTLRRSLLVRLDPSPRLDVLIEAGVLPSDHQGTADVRDAYKATLSRAEE